MWITLTREQKAILFLWYGSEGKYGWNEDDFVHGIHKVQRYYPDHRPEPVINFDRGNSNFNSEPF